jgi:predicted GNAT family acetyltransferase
VNLTMVDNPAESRYEARTDDDTLAGLVAYTRYADRIVLVHTETCPSFEDHGVASFLARGILDELRGTDLRVVPTCPFIRAYIKRHPEYADLVRR